MEKISGTIVLSFLFFGFAFIGHAQEFIKSSVDEQGAYVAVRLKDSSLLEGHIIDADKNMITIKPHSGGRIIIYRNSIKDIYKNNVKDRSRGLFRDGDYPPGDAFSQSFQNEGKSIEAVISIAQLVHLTVGARVQQLLEGAHIGLHGHEQLLIISAVCHELLYIFINGLCEAYLVLS